MTEDRFFMVLFVSLQNIVAIGSSVIVGLASNDVFAGLFLYLFCYGITGLLIQLVIGPPFHLKIVLFWLPACLSERVQDWADK